MSEISCRAFSYFQAAEKAGVVSLDAVIEGLPVTRADLERPSNRVSWDVWAQLCDRFALAIGGDEALRDCAPFVLTEGFSGYLSKAIGAATDTRQLYELAANWVGPSIYRSVQFSSEPADGGSLLWSAELLPGFRPCRPWFLMLESALARVPAFAGLPDAVVERLELNDRAARFRVTPPPSASLGNLLRRAFAALKAPDALFSELYTQQVQLNAALVNMRRSAGAFRNTLDSLPHLVAVHADGRLLYANPAFAHFFGRDAAELTDADLASFFPDRGATPFGVEPERVRVQRGIEQHELEVRSVPGVEFAEREAALFVGRDLTVERRASERAARSEAAVAALLESFPDLVLRFDANLRLLSVHGGTAVPEHSGLHAAIGATLAEARSLLNRPGSAAIDRGADDLAAVLRGGSQLTRGISLPSGQELLVRFVPLGDEVMVVVHDETERKSVQRRLEIAERLASLGTLTAGVAHEINNPLTWLLGNLDTLETELAGPTPNLDTARLLLAEARDGATRIRETVGRMRELGQAQEPSRSRVLLADVIHGAARITHHEVRHVARLDLDLPQVSPVLADPTELGQVFVNLLANAAQAMPAGASPTSHVVRVTLRERDGQLVTTVADCGRGVPPEIIGRIFDPFVTTRHRASGTGLGLAITHRIVEAHGGTISVESEPGKTVFTVVLPVAPPLEDGAEPERPPVPTETASRRAHVLVIDDETMVSRSVVRMLPEHDVVVAASADEGLARLTESTPDLVLCDLMMPGRTGMELYDALAATRPELLPRLVFMTGGTFTERAEEFVHQRGVRVLAKPFDAAAVRGLVATALAPG